MEVKMVTINQVYEYLSENIFDPVPKYIFFKEILKKPSSSREYIEAYNNMVQSKWYRELADNQSEDGSWGSAFHGGNVSASKGHKFPCTEAALRRARELSLSKNEPMIAKCIHLFEKYISGETSPPDGVEVHEDGGKGNRIWHGFGPAANISMFDSQNPFIKPFQKSVVDIYKIAFKSGYFDEEFFFEAENDYRVYILAHPRNSFSLMLLREADYLEESLQREHLSYVWGKSAAIKMNPKYMYKEKKYRVENAPDHIVYT